MPALHRSALPRRADRPLADLAEGPAQCRGHAADLQRRRRHELRDARARQPAARLRLRRAARRPDRGAAREAGRDAADTGRRRPRSHPRRPHDRGRRAVCCARRDHGRRGERDRRVDDGGAARGGELRAVHDLPHVGAAAASHRGLEPLGEGRRSVPRRARGDARDPAHRRACRSALGRAHGRAREASGAAGHSPTGPSGPTG